MKNLIILLAVAVFLIPQVSFAKSKLERAEDYITINENGQASRLISEAILADPLNADLHYKAGELYFQLDNLASRDKAFNNACKLDHSYCEKVSFYYRHSGFYFLNRGNRDIYAINYFKKAIELNPGIKGEIFKKLLSTGENDLNKSNPSKTDFYYLTKSDSYFKVLNSLDRSYGKKIANIYIKKSQRIKASDGLLLLKKAVNFDSSQKKEVGNIAAKLAKDDKYTEYEKSMFKDYASKCLNKSEMLAQFPPDFRELKIGMENAYRIENMKKGQSNGFYIRQPKGRPTWQFTTSFATGVKAVLRDGREFDLSKGKPLPGGDYDFKLVAYEDGARAMVWFQIPE